jgi:hypothetical protein
VAKRILLYNLADHVTDEEFKEYVTKEKGPLLDSLESAKKYELVKITGSMTGQIPYKYVGIMHLTSFEEYNQKDAGSQKMKDFGAKFGTMVKEIISLDGEEIY